MTSAVSGCSSPSRRRDGGEGLAQQRLGLGVLARACRMATSSAELVGGVGVAFAEGLAVDVDGLLIKGLRFLQIVRGRRTQPRKARVPA